MKYVGFFLLCLLASLAFTFVYYGGFHPVTVVEREIGPYNFIFEVNRGDYSQTGKSVEKLMKIASDAGVKSQGFGMYFDDPSKVAKEDLRSHAGIVVSDADLQKLSPTIAGFDVQAFAKTNAVVSNFPLKGFPSILIAIWKVYSAMMTYSAEKNLKTSYSIEIYEIEKQNTIYALPIQP